jgi:DNA polymerase I-like protein with 3'-5' exonuclease and polymerase domains
MELIPPAELLPYQGADADATLQVSEVFREELLADYRLTRFYLRVLHPAARAFEKIERRGILVDEAKYRALGEHLGTEIRRLELAALDLLPQRLKAKHRDRIADQLGKGKSPFTAKLLEDYFFSPQGLDLHPKMVTEKTGRPSTARAHLRMFAANDDAEAMCETLEALNSAAKTRSTFVEGFLQHLRPDGRLHPSYMLFHGAYNDDARDESGTVSGRLAAKDPAIQTLPKKTQWAKLLRACFIAPPGKIIVVTDYAQGELKVVACIAGEKNMIAAYKEGLDLHAVTGARLGGVPYEAFVAWGKGDDAKLAALYDDLRTRAKAGNFGLLYGMGAEGFRAYAWANYGLQLTLEEAEAIHAAFFAMYPGLHTYHDRMRQLARQLKMVRTPLGRIRHLPLIDSPDRGLRARAERQAINSPVQGCLSDMTIWAAALIEAELSPQVEVVGMIHDALINYVPDDDPIFWAGQITQLMANLPLGELDWQPQLTFTADAEVGADLAHLKKLVLAA